MLEHFAKLFMEAAAISGGAYCGLVVAWATTRSLGSILARTIPR